MNPLELYNKYAPFIQGNPAAIYPDLVCLSEEDVNLAVYYVCSLSNGEWDVDYGYGNWRKDFFSEEGGTWGVDIDNKQLLDLLCHTVCHMTDHPDLSRYALISCLYSIPEVAGNHTAVHTLRTLRAPAWASNLYRSKYGQVDWSMAETLYLRKERMPEFCTKYGLHRSRKDVANRGRVVPYWVKYWKDTEYLLVEHITSEQEIEQNQVVQVKFNPAYDFDNL